MCYFRLSYNKLQYSRHATTDNIRIEYNKNEIAFLISFFLFFFLLLDILPVCGLISTIDFLANMLPKSIFTFTNIFKTIGKVLVFLPGFPKFPQCHHFVFLFVNILSQEFLCRMAIPSRITTLSCRFDRNSQSVMTK